MCGASPSRIGFDVDWQIGDHAECITRSWWETKDRSGLPVSGPQYGEVRVVADVRIFDFDCGCAVKSIAFARYPGSFFVADEFRKIVPRVEEASRATAAFIAGLKPARIPVPELA